MTFCGTKNTTTENNNTEVTQQLPTLLAGYMYIKEGLIASNSDQVKTTAQALLGNLEKELNTASASLKEEIIALAATETLENQKIIFQSLTTMLAEMTKSTGSNIPVFIQFCPMAFDNQGGTWLSLSEEIKNPYFGEMMLTCGRVEETIN